MGVPALQIYNIYIKVLCNGRIDLVGACDKVNLEKPRMDYFQLIWSLGFTVMTRKDWSQVNEIKQP